jgi:death on curing protein
MKDIKYLLKEQIISINKEVTSEYSQNHFVQQEANLIHTLDRMTKYAETIKDKNTKILRKAAFLLYNLAYKDHVFLDGNKRTSILSCMAFLKQNKIHVFFDESEQDDLAKTVKEIASGKMNISSISKWLEKHIITVFK